MRRVDAGAAVFCVSERDQVMHHEDRPDIALSHCTVVAEALHATVTRMQQNRIVESLAARRQEATHDERSNRGAGGGRTEQQIESSFRVCSGEHFRIAEFTQNRAGTRSIMLNICEADAIDASWQQAVCKARQQSGNIKADIQHGGV